MEYYRYDKDCDWYIFGQTTSPDIEEEQLLAVGHFDHQAKCPIINFLKTMHALEDGDFARIPSYSEEELDIVQSMGAQNSRPKYT